MSKPENDALRREVDSALEGLNLQEFDLAPRADAKGKRQEQLQTGVVTGVHGDDVFVELGPRMQGLIAVREFDEPPSIGESFEFSLHGQEDGLWVCSRKTVKALAAWRDMEVGSDVQAVVKAANKGGLELEVGPLPAFMPASHIDLNRVEDLESKVGETMVCEVLEVDRDRRRVLLSRRAVMQRERESARLEAVGNLTPGSTVRGKVTRVESFGAFVDVGGGVEGLVHVSNLSRKRVEKPDEFVSVGQEVQAMILEIKDGGKRIGLGMKQLEPDPWDDAQYRFRSGSIVTGKVTRLAEFGAFIEIADGLDGLLHRSQIGNQQQNVGVHKLLTLGQEVMVRVQEVDPAQRRISLSRMDERGALIGSEDAVEAGEVDRVINESESREVSTNLGNLFKKALGKQTPE